MQCPLDQREAGVRRGDVGIGLDDLEAQHAITCRVS
jgi:hypothetical protein